MGEGLVCTGWVRVWFLKGEGTGLEREGLVS